MAKKYSKFDPSAASIQGSGIFGLPYKEVSSQVIYIGVPWEVTTSYRGGTSLGPELIVSCSSQIDLFDEELDNFYEHGLFYCGEDKKVLRWNKEGKKLAQKVIKVGGQIGSSQALKRALSVVNKLSEKLNDHVYTQTKKILEKKKKAVIIGGDHSVPLGALKAIAEKFGDFSILHFDAHSDTRIAYEGFKYSHASIMYNALTEVDAIKKIVQVGIRDFSQEELKFCQSQGDRIRMFTDHQLSQLKFKGIPFKEVATDIASILTDKVWISVDIDGLDPSFCPGTGTPVPGGLHYLELIEIVRTVKMLGKEIVGFDINEVSPGEGVNAPNWGTSEWNGIVGSRLLYKLTGLMLKK